MTTLPPLPSNFPLRIQDLPPKWAHLALEVSSFTEKIISASLSEKKILIAVSGGVDSLCLLFMLKALQNKFNLSLEVAHLDHGFRQSSAQEAKWVEDLCMKLELVCHVQHARNFFEKNCALNGLEEKGRNWRYAFFAELCRERGIDYVALAHNLNDLGEDQLMRMLRGCGWPELGGMPAHDPRRRIIRPILMQPRKLLQQMLYELQIPFITDESNSSPKFMRNRVRINILPQLMEENCGYLEHVKNLWWLAQMDQAFWGEYLDKFEPEIRGNQIVLPFSLLLEEAGAVRLKMFRLCLQKLAERNNHKQIFTPAQQLFEINQAILRRKSGQGSGVMQIQFPGGIVAIVDKSEIIFRSEQRL